MFGIGDIRDRVGTIGGAVVDRGRQVGGGVADVVTGGADRISKLPQLPGDVLDLIGDNAPVIRELLAYQKDNGLNKDVLAVIKWAREGQKGAPPTDDPKLLAILIRTADPQAADAFEAFYKRHPEAKGDLAAVMKWAIATKDLPDAKKGLPPSENPEVLALLIGLKDPAAGQAFAGFVKANPGARADALAVMKWAITTKDLPANQKGAPPTDNPQLLATLIGLREPKLGKDLAAYAGKHPERAGDVAKLAKWLIASGGKPRSLPPTFDPGLLLLLAKFGLNKVLSR